MCSEEGTVQSHKRAGDSRIIGVAGKSMLQLRHAKYATRSIDEYARKDGALFRSTTSGPGEPCERAKAWALDDRRH